ncbi:hypothetical protein [Leisingera methylohalidivorans]|uniref:Uncharacterized protein n=1 Tax=Leisingera methylohalidivorans DSM 14336 TaxID=999552 RepID=V9VZZ7_9RHOB|nr:hypothetical protein [Leisingera methylohalidivorans]AHD02950.1 hypothetical protein METH_06880 [Leisingera methylohalidivorans DSM 14336]
MTQNHLGKTIFVAKALPATNDSAGFEALTWVQAKGLITLPQLGTSHSMIDIPDLSTGFTTAVKGAGQGVDTTMTFRKVDGDTGQADLIGQAIDNDGILSVKIVNGTGTDTGHGPAPVTGDAVEYAQGIAHSYQPNQGDNSSHEGFQAGFRQNALTVEATQPA